MVKNDIKKIKPYSLENASETSSIKYANNFASFVYSPYQNNTELYFY